jgi:hypothetical protein
MNRINEAYDKFCALESLMSESYSPTHVERVVAFEKFLALEDAKEGRDSKRSLTEIWGALKKAGKWISKKIAGKRSLEKGGSLFGWGKKSKAQRAENTRMTGDAALPEEKAVMAAIKSNIDEDEYPNMDSKDEFIDQTNAVTKAIDDLVARDKDNAEIYVKTFNKWLSYILDQKIGDHYKHFMEYKKSRLPLLAEKKEEDEEGGLGTKAGSSESVKGLKSELLPKILKVLGGIGMAVAGGVLAAHPDILTMDFLHGIDVENTDLVRRAADRIPPITLRSRFVKDCITEYVGAATRGRVTLSTATDYKNFLEHFAGGPAAFFRAIGVDDASANSDYIMQRLSSGMNPEEAFKIGKKVAAGAKLSATSDVVNPWSSSGGMVKGMERMGGAIGRPVSLAGVLLPMVGNRAVHTITTQFIGTGVAGATTAIVGGAAAGALGLGALLSGIAVKALRKSSLDGKDASRASYLNSIYKQAKSAEENLPEPESSPEAGSRSGSKGSGSGRKFRKVGRDIVRKLVNLLDEKGAIKIDDDYLQTDSESDEKSLEDDLKKPDDKFERVPPAQSLFVKKLIGDRDVQNLLGTDYLPLFVMAYRRALKEPVKISGEEGLETYDPSSDTHTPASSIGTATKVGKLLSEPEKNTIIDNVMKDQETYTLAEAIALILHHGRRVLIERKQREGQMITERWQKLAGVLRG